MFLYRIVPKEQKKLINDEWTGINTFNYEEEKKYVHFFIMPEHAEIFQCLRYKNKDINSEILQFDIDIKKLKKQNFGCGMYRWYHPKIKHPFFEVRLEENLANQLSVIDKSDSIKPEWTNKEIYEKYLKNVVNDIGGSVYPVIMDLQYDEKKHFFNETVTLNENFVFSDYCSGKEFKNSPILDEETKTPKF